MGLACAQVNLLMLTQRKADCQLGISLAAMDKMALTREQSELSSEYQSRLQAKKICYYNNGQYNKMNYAYLMGSPAVGTYLAQAALGGSTPMVVKSDNAMVLTDFKGQVVMDSSYQAVMLKVLGPGAMDAQGRGGTFSSDKIPELIAAMTAAVSLEDIKAYINNEDISGKTFASHTVNSMTQETTSTGGTTDYSPQVNSQVEAIVNFFYPIFKAAAVNGWTSEYCKEMALNDDYISDAIVTGTFQLEHVNSFGQYEEDTSLTYFITSGQILSRTDSEIRAEITAWYDAEKARLSAKENEIDLRMSDWSTELEAINAEIQSIQSFINDAVQSVFDWGSG